MKILSKNDLLKVKICSLVADYDHETIVNLYQPIIGYIAVTLYFTLLNEGKNQTVYGEQKHEQVFLKMQMNAGDFIKARHALEAVGLLKTYCLGDENDEIKYYTYEVFAPRTPDQFFSNALFYGMLINCIGEEEAKKIKSLYPGNELSQGNDISVNFTDVFNASFDDESFAKAIDDDAKSLGRNTSKVNGKFSYEEFFNYVKSLEQGINEHSFNEKEVKQIERICILYEIDEKSAADLVLRCFDVTKEKGMRVDFDELTKLARKQTAYGFNIAKKSNNANLVSGNSSIASKINLMETVNPKKFLTILQNGAAAALPDLRIIEDLSNKFNLTNAVINVLLDYCLSCCNNILSRAFAEKVAASLAREGVTTAIDAMNYLNDSSTKKKKRTSVTQVSSDTRSTHEDKQNKEEDDGPSWEELMDMLDTGDSDGKA